LGGALVVVIRVVVDIGPGAVVVAILVNTITVGIAGKVKLGSAGKVRSDSGGGGYPSALQAREKSSIEPGKRVSSTLGKKRECR
jgi:hypothetical protein